MNKNNKASYWDVQPGELYVKLMKQSPFSNSTLGRLQMKHCDQLGIISYQERIEQLGKVQRREMKIIKSLLSMTQGERLKNKFCLV